MQVVEIGGQESCTVSSSASCSTSLIVALALFVFIVKYLGRVMRARTQAAAEPERRDAGGGAARRDPRIC